MKLVSNRAGQGVAEYVLILVLVAIGVVIALIFLDGQIPAVDVIVFNRLGILMSFAAGILLAPELIGLRRLQRLEDWIESAAIRIGYQLARVIRLLIGKWGARILIAVAFLSIAGVMAAAGTLAGGIKLLPRDWALAVGFWGFVLAGLIWVWFLALMAIGFLGAVLMRMLDALAGNDRLAGWVTASGVICLVLGGALQFVATF